MLKEHDQLKKMDKGELEFPETSYVRDIDSKVFQGILLQVLAKIEGIGLIGGNLFDALLGRDSVEGIKGLHVEQDLEKHSVYIRVEVNIRYGISIPVKAEEIQTKIVQEVSLLTGLHVSCVHVVFKNLILPTDENVKENPLKELQEKVKTGIF